MREKTINDPDESEWQATGLHRKPPDDLRITCFCSVLSRDGHCFLVNARYAER
jgi:hypothetical protein